MAYISRTLIQYLLSLPPLFSGISFQRSVAFDLSVEEEEDGEGEKEKGKDKDKEGQSEDGGTVSERQSQSDQFGALCSKMAQIWSLVRELGRDTRIQERDISMYTLQSLQLSLQYDTYDQIVVQCFLK